MRKHFVLLGILGLGMGLAGFAQQSSTTTLTSTTSGPVTIKQGKCVSVKAGDGCNTCTVCKDSTGHYSEMMACTLLRCVPSEEQLKAYDALIEKEAAQQQKSVTAGAGKPKITVRFKHAMGMPCKGDDPVVCHLTVEDIRLDEKNPNHESVNLSTDKQDSLHISGEKPFTVEFVSDDNGPAPFYRPTGKPSKVFASGPARPEASGHHYHMVIRDEEGVTDPHICIGGGGSSC